jgi:hypothetical protein
MKITYTQHIAYEMGQKHGNALVYVFLYPVFTVFILAIEAAHEDYFLCVFQHPVLMLAREATHEDYFYTTHNI